MEKYLGNKAALLPLLESFITSRLSNVSTISDLFSGTTNVSRYFAARGYGVVIGDLNRFSYVLAQAYVGQAEPPAFDQLTGLRKNAARVDRLQVEFHRALRKSGDTYLPGYAPAQLWGAFRPLANVLAHLQDIGDRNNKPWIVTEYFTQWGRKAAFQSMRGSVGKRNYFSRSNALVLDGILRTIRAWWLEERLTRDELFTLLTSVLEEVVITANVSGTFHDFNRDRLWPNALQPFFLRLPLIRTACQSVEITNDDAVLAAGYISAHDVCYIDPPYNFRQYSAYYHFLNFVAATPVIEDLATYLDGLSHVRGQNPEDDASSDFCSKARFVSVLRTLIERTPAENFVLSYYNGRNHWNHWSAVDTPTSEGLVRLTALFADRELFDEFEVVPALNVRRNYQSRAGERKALINEYLLMGHKRQSGCSSRKVFVPLGANRHWGVDKIFTHTVANTQKFTQTTQLKGVAC